MSRRRNLSIAVAVGIALAAGAAWQLLRTPKASAPWLGYIEGEALYIAAPVAGTLAALPVTRGGRAQAGNLLFTLDATTSDAQVNQMAAELAAAKADLADLQAQRDRPPELAVSKAAQASSRAQIARAQSEYERYRKLAADGYATQAQLDAARESLDIAKASLAQAQAQERSGQLTAGRTAQLRAAQARVASAQSALQGQQRQRAEISPRAPMAGAIEQTYFDIGEWVPANSPVVSVLPDDKRKLRFYVPQTRVSALRPGDKVAFDCDGCGPTRVAIIRYISPRAEFTPPVIYSERARAKLVFMVEAALPPEAASLPVGLPVDVQPAALR